MCVGSDDDADSALTGTHAQVYGSENFDEGFSDIDILIDNDGSEDVFGEMNVGVPVWTIKPFGGLYFDFIIAQDASDENISDGTSSDAIPKRTFKFAGGGVFVGVEGDISYTYYMLVYGVPVYIGGSVTAKILGQIGATEKNGISLSPADMFKSKTYSQNLVYDYCFRANVTGSGYAGVGICGVAGVRGGIELSVNFIANPTITKLYPDVRTTGFNYSGTIRFWLDAVLATISCPTYTFASVNTGYFEDMTEKNAELMTASAEDETDAAAKPYVKPRASGQSVWTANDSLSLQSTYSPISSRPLNENGYDAPDQQIISLGENKALLVFLDDDPARTDENRTVLKYAVYDNGSWTEPKVIQNDGTADFDPNLCDAGDKVIISWTSREETELGSEVTTEYLKTMEVYTAVFDKSTAALGEIVKLTDDDCYDSAPKAIYDSETGDVLVHYTKSDVTTDNFVEEAMVTLNNSEQAYMLYDGESGEWVRDRYFENELAEGADEDNLINNFGAQRFLRAPIEEFGINNPVITDFTASTLTTFELPDYYENYDFESMSDEEFGELVSYMIDNTSNVGVYAYTVDADNSLDTDGDRELFIQYYDYKKHKTSDPIRITNNNVCDSSPMFAGKDSSLYLFWLEDGGQINYIDLADILAGEVVDGIVSPNVTYSYGCVSTDKLEDGSEPAISGFTAFVDSDEDLFVAWVQPDEDEEGQSRGQEVYAASYINSLDHDNVAVTSWSDGVQLTDNGRINELPVFTALDGGSIMMINNQYNMDLSQEIYNTSDVQLTETVFKEVPSLKITNVEVNSIPENPGDKFTADITLKNTGLKDAYGFEINGGIRINGANEAENAFTEKAETIDEYLERDPELEEFAEWYAKNCIPAGGSITITEEFTLSEEGAKDLSKIVCYADISEQDAEGIISSECTVFEGEPEYEFENVEVTQNGDEFVLAGIIRNIGSAASESGDKLTAEFNNIYYQPVDGEVFAQTELEPLEPGEFRSFEMNLTISDDKLVNGVTNGWITVKDRDGNNCADGTNFGVLLSNPYGLSVNGGAEELTIKAGEELELEGSYKGAGYFMNGRMLYTVDDTLTAAVSGNVLRGVSEGETMLKMTVNPFGGTKTVKVTVTEGDSPAPTPEPTETPAPAPTQKPGASGGSSGTTSSGSHIGSTIAGGSSATIPAAAQAPAPAVNTGRFADVRQGDWFFEAVESMADLGVVNGVTDTAFEPQTEVTRAMFAAMLYRYEGEPQTDYAMTFKDVPADAYYTEAVRWAASAGIINGYDEDTFAPDDRITREQAAAILYRYAKTAGCDMSVGENTNILSYDDAFIISEYAIPALQWTAGFGVMSGRTDTTLNPLDNLTRAETAQVIYNYRTAYMNSRNEREVTEIE
ncbi:MAG: S-layer homology domain-containing protein [Candidatus Ornithomonoglobus sp.]